MLRADNGNWLAHRLFPHGGSMRQGKRITAAPQCISENGESGSAALWYKAKNADRRATEKGSGQGSVSNKDGTATGPGSSAKSRSKQDPQHAIGGQGSAT